MSKTEEGAVDLDFGCAFPQQVCPLLDSQVKYNQTFDFGKENSPYFHVQDVKLDQKYNCIPLKTSLLP